MTSYEDELHHLLSTDAAIVNAVDPNIFFGLRRFIKKKNTSPGPTTYFPQNNLFGKTHPKAMLRYISKPIYEYYYKTSVPVVERAYIKRANLEPGPGRFDPPSAIGPTHPTKQEYWPDVFYVALMERIKKHRGLDYTSYNLKNYVEDANLRNIKGHGFTRLFQRHSSDKFEFKRVLSDKNFIANVSDGLKAKILNPRRQILSFRSEPIKYKQKPMELNIGKRFKQRKAYENTKVAFSSGMPRWPDETFTKRIEVQKRQDEIPKNPAYAHIEAQFRLISKKYKPKIIKVSKYYRFTGLPPTKKLMESKPIGIIPSHVPKSTFFQELDFKDLRKQKYRNASVPNFIELPGMIQME